MLRFLCCCMFVVFCVYYYMCACFVVGSFLFTSLLFEFFTQRVQSKTAPAAPLQVLDEMPPEPHLQVVPGLDLGQIRAAEEEKLGGYGWVDEGRKIVHIPIEKAMDVVVAGGGAAPATPTESGSESESGSEGAADTQ